MFKKFLVSLFVGLESFSFLSCSCFAGKCGTTKCDLGVVENRDFSKVVNRDKGKNKRVTVNFNLNVNKGKSDEFEMKKESEVLCGSSRPSKQKEKILGTKSFVANDKIESKSVVAAESKESGGASKQKEENKGLGYCILKWIKEIRFLGWLPKGLRAAIGEIDLTFTAWSLLSLLLTGKDLMTLALEKCGIEIIVEKKECGIKVLSKK